MRKLFLIFTLILSWSVISWADSPLTSTDFSVAYATNPMVKMAKDIQGTLPTALLSFMAEETAPIDERLAVVNQLGWDFDGTSYSEQLCDFLMKKHNVNDESELTDCLDAGTLAVYAYATAMSDYFDVSYACLLGRLAVEKDKGKSFSIAMIVALIESQDAMDSDWSQVYETVADVIKDESLHRDMKQEAIDIIMEYIDLYK